MKKLKTLTEAIRVAEEVVAERGEDFVYPEEWKVKDESNIATCMYFSTNSKHEPRCIIGAIIDKQDGTWRDAHEMASVSQFIEDITTASQREDISRFLSSLQYAQDDGYSWGDALEYAMDEAGIA